jgi:hypothetical protein
MDSSIEAQRLAHEPYTVWQIILFPTFRQQVLEKKEMKIIIANHFYNIIIITKIDWI